MRTIWAVLAALLLLSHSAPAEPLTALAKLKALPHADVGKLIGSWEVAEMAPMKMIYEFTAGTVAMHGRNANASVTFELTMDADYRTAGQDAIWVIGTNPRSGPDEEPPESTAPSIMGVELKGDGRAVLVVSESERFTLVKVP